MSRYFYAVDTVFSTAGSGGQEVLLVAKGDKEFAMANANKENKEQARTGIYSLFLWAIWWIILPFRAVFWFVVGAVLLPWRTLKWVFIGGPKHLWDEYICFLKLDFDYDAHGNPKIAYLVSMDETIHLHPLAWGPLLIAMVVAGIRQAFGPDVLPWAEPFSGIAIVLMIIYCGVTIRYDLPVWHFVGAVLGLFIGVPVFDYFVGRFSTEIDQALVASQYPSLFAWAHRGFLRPAWDGVVWLDAGVSVGFLVLFSIPWLVYVYWVILKSLLNNRYSYDGQHVTRYKAGDGSASQPTYYGRANARKKDWLEAIWGFGSAEFGSGPNALVLKAVPFLALASRRIKLEIIRSGHDGTPHNGSADVTLGQMSKKPNEAELDANASAE